MAEQEFSLAVRIIGGLIAAGIVGTLALMGIAAVSVAAYGIWELLGVRVNHPRVWFKKEVS